MKAYRNYQMEVEIVEGYKNNPNYPGDGWVLIITKADQEPRWVNAFSVTTKKDIQAEKVLYTHTTKTNK